METGRQNAIETEVAQGIIRYMGFICSLSAISHNRAAKMVIVEEFEVTCVITLITRTHIRSTMGCETPKTRLEPRNCR